MKKNRIYCMAAAIAMLAGSCSSDTFEPGNSGNVSPEDGVYMTVNIAMPTAAKGTRSETTGPNQSSGGVEIGQDYENKVSEVLIVLAKSTDNKFITAATVRSEDLTAVTNQNGVYRTISKFSKTAMNTYYSAGDFERDVNIFVFCNPTKALYDVIKAAQYDDATWFNQMGEFDLTVGSENTIWGENQFLMGNNAIATRTLPADMSDWNNYSTANSPFNLSGMNMEGRPNQIDNYSNGKGNIRVERASARFDFRDGSIDGTKEGVDKNQYNGIGDNTYEVVYDVTSTGEKGPSLVNVKLGKMALVNMNKKFYYLRRTSADGLPTNMSLCGPELPWVLGANGAVTTAGNYVVDAFAEWKNGKPTTGFSTHFNYPFFNEDGTIDNNNAASDRWGTSLIDDVLKKSEDNDDTWNDGTKGDYHIWRYCIESTIPGDPSNQVNGVTTGVVFKGKMIATKYAAGLDESWRKQLVAAINNSSNTNRDPLTDPILYSFGGHLYVTWENIRRAAISASVTDLKYDSTTQKWTYIVNRSNSLYQAVFGNGGFGTLTFSYNQTDADGNFLETGTETLVDEMPQDEQSANYKWQQWAEAGKKNDASFTAMKKAVVENAGITIYQSSYDEKLGGWGYYCYYYYWNRHNDNNQAGIMGNMEFDVVRNNVYKLAVTKIARLGHPRISENDPDKPKPGTDDELGNVYITVQCEALPWVVRVNDIVFD